MQLTIYNQYESKLKAEFLKVFHAEHGKLHNNHLGPKVYTEFQKLMCVILYKRSLRSYVRFVDELHESLWPRWLGLREIPGKSSVQRWLKQTPRRLLRKFSNKLLPQKPKLLAIDATGIDSWRRSRHYEHRIGDTHMPYAKLDVIIDVDTKMVFDHVLRIKPRHETVAASQMLKRSQFSDVRLLGDKAYDSEPLHELARAHGIELYAPVRSSPLKRPRGRFRRQCARGALDYPRRNVVESFMHTLKSVHCPALKSRHPWTKKKEIAIALLLHNLERKIQTIIAQILKVIWDAPETAVNPRLLDDSFLNQSQFSKFTEMWEVAFLNRRNR
jgi:transposase